MEFTGPQAVTLAALAASTGIATIGDLAYRRIPNALSLATAAAGIVLASAGLTGITLWSSLAGLGIGFALMMPGHVLGATGAGDVKLFAAAGTLLGATQTFEAFLFVAIAGGVVALAVACMRGRLACTIARTARLFGRTASRAEIESPAENNRFAYGPAIAVGCIVAALW